jgi:hypothetical protein
VDFDELSTTTNYYHVLLTAPEQFMFFMVNYALTAITQPKTWQPVGTISYNFVGASIFSTNSFFFGVNGTWNGNTNSSAIIFRMNPVDLTGTTDLNDYSCVSFRDLRPQDYNS